MIWFRWYNGTCADPKLGSIARRAGATRERVIATWAMVLESAADVSDGGRFKIDADGIADVLNCETASIEAVLAEMQSAGMLSDGTVTAFSRRNFNSDNSTERVRKHREQKRNGDETFQDRFVTPPEAEAEAEAEAETEAEEHREGKLPDVTEGSEIQKQQRATAAAVGELCSILNVPWPLKEAIGEWSSRQDRDPRFASLDLPRETRKCLEWCQANRRRPKAVTVMLLNWYEKALEHPPSRNGNGNHRTTAVQQYAPGIQSPEEVRWKN